MQTISIDDQYYPKQLLNIHDPPKKIHIEGDLISSDEKAIAIVGTRRPSHYGISIAKRFAYELASLGITVVSGMALGIDTAAHNGALEAKGRTIAVLGTGLDVVYPQGNLELYSRIILSGAAVSELSPNTGPANWTFPRRNRIISGLSYGVLVVEGGYKSGAMITAKQALDQGREVFAIPGNIESELSCGPHWLIKQGAKLVESIDDILSELVHVLKIPTSVVNIEMIPKIKIDHSMLTLEEQLLYKELSFSPLHIDEICAKSSMDISQILVLLSQMEMKRFIKQLPGKMFIVNS